MNLPLYDADILPGNSKEIGKENSKEIVKIYSARILKPIPQTASI